MCARSYSSPSEHENRAAARVYTTCTQPKTLAITFDDGPNTYTKTIVDTLDKAGGKATFFFNGKNYNCIYDTTNADRAKYAFDRGHQVASHTWSHLHLPTLSTAQITSEFQRANDAIKKITGAVPRLFALLLESTTQTFRTSLDPSDNPWSLGIWTRKTGTEPRSLKLRPPILTLGSPSDHSWDVLRTSTPWVINYAKSKGYKLVTVAECVGSALHLKRFSFGP
ncbi:chitin deacetylase [Rhizoctonia solani]|uniref:Chitin deacetylase n=1 Tax=Rhizoctonia solani TaxID=456999 RepID=A0A8H8T1E0_9AGAM|nr:chitin deacetylase [Rhizoctonia solani]QRW25269.1 chitin deacetylase [Rhizoctonia solani]